MRHPLRLTVLAAAILACALGPASASAQTSTPSAATSESPGKAWRPKAGEAERPANEIPDNTVLLRVGPDSVTVKDFVWRYFNAYPDGRPNTDSAGRVQFLSTLEKALVLRRAALDRDRPLDFGERATMREHTDRVLSNVLYQRFVADSSVVTERELRELYSMLKTEIRLREITFRQLADAQRVYDRLRSKAMTWEQAYRRYHEIAPKPDLGDLGWVTRSSGEAEMVERIVRLQKGEIAVPWQDVNGAHLVQCTDLRAGSPPPFEAMRGRLQALVRMPRLAERTEKIAVLLRKRIGMTYDTTNVLWAAQQFEDNMAISGGGGGAPVIQLGSRLPSISKADTGRVLARHRDGRVTMSQFMEAYRALPAVARPAVNTPDRLLNQVDGFALEPYRTQLARERGLESDPLAIEWIGKRRDEIMVDRLYQDSVESHVSVSEDAVRRYYEANRAQYITYPAVRYALWVSPRRAEADSMAAQLTGGKRLDSFIRADSVERREKRGMIRVMRQNEEGTDFYTELFGGELRPGDARVFGPDREGKFAVLQSLEFDAGRQLSLEEAYRLVDERVRQEQSERLLDQFVARLRRGMKIESSPEQLMRFAMTDPTL